MSRSQRIQIGQRSQRSQLGQSSAKPRRTAGHSGTAQLAWRSGAAQRTRGVSLIEILVALLLVSIGLLGMVGLQARAVQTSVDAEDSLRAAMLANDISAAMWVQRSVNLPAASITTWQDAVADTAGRGLPSGEGEVTVNGNEAQIEVRWQPPRAQAGDQARHYVTHVVIP